MHSMLSHCLATASQCAPSDILLLLQLQKEKDVVEQQFNQLYHDKYQPLKDKHKAVVAGNQQLQEQQRQAQEQVEKLRTQLATADLKLRKSGLEAQALSQQLQQSQSSLEVGPKTHAQFLWNCALSPSNL